MTKIVRSRIFIVLIAGIFFIFSIAQSYEFPRQQSVNQERIAVLPIASNDIPQEELIKLTQEFRTALQNTARFDIQPEIEIDSLLKAKKFLNISGCNYALCLADAGKALEVPKVMRIDITKREDQFAARIRIVQTADADVLFDRVFNHSGDIDSYRSISIPEQIKTLSTQELDQDSSWLHPAIIVAVVLGIIYIIYKSFDSHSSSGGTGGGGSTTPQ